MGVVSTEVMEKDVDFQSLLVAQVEGSVSGITDSSSKVFMITHLILVFDILTIVPGIEFKGPMTEAALH